MPAPYLTAWNPTAIAASNTALLTLLDSHATLPAKITIHDAADVLLASIDLTDPAGTVSGTTGVLTLAQGAREDAAPAGGTASYGTIRDGAGTAYRSLPCEAGAEPVVGKLVLNTLAIVQGAPVELVSAVVL